MTEVRKGYLFAREDEHEIVRLAWEGLAVRHVQVRGEAVLYFAYLPHLSLKKGRSNPSPEIATVTKNCK